MRGRRRVAPVCCAVALVLAAAPAAFAQDAPVEPAAAPAAEPAPPDGAAAPPVGAPATTAPADQPATAPAEPATTASPLVAPAPAEPAPASAEPAAAAPDAPAAASAEPATAPAAAPPRAAPAAAARPAAPRKGVVRSRPRPRPAANMSQAEVQISEFGGRVIIRDVEVLGCAGGTCGSSSLADYEVRGLEVRAEPEDPPLLSVTSATVTGTGSDRRVAARVVIRPPGEAASTGDVTLKPGEDLLALSVFAGTDLEAAYRRLRESTTTLFGPGGPLERLTIVFGEGTVLKGSFGAVSISAADQLVSVRVPVRLDDEGALVRAGPPFVDRRPTDSSQQRAARQRTSRDALGDDRPSDPPGVGSDTGGRPVSGGIQKPAPEEDEEGGGLFGTIISTCVLGVGACGGDDDEEQVVRFVVDSRSATITIDRTGSGPLEIGCPSGFDDVTGTALIESGIRQGEAQRPLSRLAEFTCDAEIVRIEIELLDEELDRLRDARGPVTVQVTVRVTAEDGLRAVDFDVVTLELAT